MSIIKIENLSKKYIIGHDKAASGMYRYSSLRDSIAHTCRGIYRRISHPFSPNTETTALEEFWALKDINLEIEQGDKVGIIGANGAGKSTLLKILSRITEPTTGKFTIKGRIASLLEVGTGFHPELSGRENIYLNGAILGMTRKEIKKKFDEIVNFSGVEKFLDTPIKRFSSGMYVRLAFAVAAHLEPEILLIDEVLAVGDAEFQKKCLGKMEDVSKQGRTILFVSHNMEVVSKLCNKSILLTNGKITTCGNTSQVIDSYNLNLNTLSFISTELHKNRHEGTLDIYGTKIEIGLEDKKNCNYWQTGKDVYIRLFITKKKNVLSRNIEVGFHILTKNMFHILYLGTRNYRPQHSFDNETNVIECKINRLPLICGQYILAYDIVDANEYLDRVNNAFLLTVEEGSFYPNGTTWKTGVILCDQKWYFHKTI